jgi:predicted transcriptional regulator
MKKTSVYLHADDVERLARLADHERVSQAEVIRRAIATYAPEGTGGRDFAVAALGAGDGSSALDIPEDELLEGFGA